jgi:hypothetical protein
MSYTAIKKLPKNNVKICNGIQTQISKKIYQKDSQTNQGHHQYGLISEWQKMKIK